MNTRKDLERPLSELQSSPNGPRGKRYWRSLEELAGSEAFQDLMCREFPEQADVWPDELCRRRFLTLMGASLALAGLGGCSVRPAPATKIVPYVKPPREIVPGKPLFFATTMCFAGTAVGLLVESHMGRPTKIEGNPDHPASRGATGPLQQASILTLYDPDRSQTVTRLGRTRSWSDALAAIRAAMQKQTDVKGAGLRILSEPIVSPTLAGLRRALLDDLPDAKWHVHAPIHRDSSLRGARLAFGDFFDVHYDFTKADVVLSLDADFLSCRPAGLHDVADFMSRRRVRTTRDAAGQATMNRLYVVETAVTGTGAKADHRLAMRAGEIERLTRAITAQLGVVTGAEAPGRGADAGQEGAREKWISAVVKDLAAHRGRSIVLAGESQPPAVHLLVHAINRRLGNAGETVHYTDPVADPPADGGASLKELADDMETGRVEFLAVLGSNPVYTAPADFDFTRKMQNVPLRVHLGLYPDETARQCHWHLPEAHYLESWGDARTFDGTASLVQPLIEPLYHGRSAVEIAGFLKDLIETPGDELVRGYWSDRWQSGSNEERSGGFSEFWQTSLHDGVIPDTAFERKSPPLKEGWEQHLQVPPSAAAAAAGAAGAASGSGELELVFQPDPTVYDGFFANNGWLQELPKPLTKLTWDNAALMSPATASRLGVALGGYAHGGEHGGYHVPVVELQLGKRTVRAPVWIVPGHADGSITVHLGYGREAAGRVGGDARNPVGFNAYALRTSDHPWFAPGLRVAKTGDTFLLACTQQHHLMENRDVVRAGTLDEYRADPGFTARRVEEKQEETTRAGEPLTLYKPFDASPPLHKWGMAIDLTACVGCNACVVACQAENNIPVVGKTQVSFGREMHWIRVDRYTGGDADHPSEFHFQPVPCMHCEQAPCEYVCPVAATVHSAEGLNDMIYNRCVGTRFCSNNCPYKVRRFNFLHYADYETPSLRLQYNPDVTVRSRGVMEKCTYCVQRIRHAEIDSQAEGRPIADGEVLTACQAACPAQAIVFGDINDAGSGVAAWKGSPLNYGLLEDLNTVPRTTYLAALRNPNPELEGA